MTALLLTHSGRLLTSESGHPSLLDIAVGLSRQPRFGGQAGRWWSVLDHTLFCDELVQAWLRDMDLPDEVMRLRQIALLLHDAHEALTGDVPTPLKTPDFKAMQDELDHRIFDAFYPGGYAMHVDRGTTASVKYIDRRALQCEARAFLNHPSERTDPIFGKADDAGYNVLLDFLGDNDYVAIPPRKTDQHEHPAVREYIRRMISLM